MTTAVFLSLRRADFPVSYTCDDLLGVDRYYFPQLYKNWYNENAVPDVEAVWRRNIKCPLFGHRVPSGRVFAGMVEMSSSYVAANGGFVLVFLFDRLTMR